MYVCKHVQFADFQINFNAQDNGVVVNTATNIALGTINIYRNDFTPNFDLDNYIITISEDTGPNVSIFDVNATDGDVGVSWNLFWSLP